jgi:hypothetical protein
VDSQLDATSLHPGIEVLPAVGTTTAVVLVLHGGKADSFEPSEPGHLSRRRLNPFAKAVHKQGAEHGVAVWKVQYRVRGWNAPEKSPAVDAQWALDEVRRVHGDIPVVLLCPWLPSEPIEGARGKKVVIAHGIVDRWTSPRETRTWASAAAPLAASLLYVRVRKTGHFMLRRGALWSDLGTGFTLTWLGLDPSVGRVATNILRQAASGATELTV